MICATPRSGSTLLCGLMAAAGAGRPDSFFRRQDLDEWAADWGLPAPVSGIDRAYLDAAIAAGYGASGVFGLRLMAETLPELMAALDRIFPGLPDDRARLEAGFGPLAFIYLCRQDRVAQAVSLVRARQTGLWHRAPDGTEIERLAPPAPPRYDRAAIAEALAQLDGAAAVWPEWFAARGIAPLVVEYGDLAADPVGTVKKLLSSLGLPPAEALTPPVARLADDLSANWIARFRRENGG